jgi:hydroxyethylthiazole kinase-like uncharacterized protein yjeF
MKPIVTVEEVRAIDQRSPDPESVLIHRAGWAVSRAALRMMGGAYGRRVVVIAGPGNNGADGRTAALFLEERGIRTQVFPPGVLDVVPDCDLVIDAAFGTGFHGSYSAPDPNGAPVLAIDIPSGVNGNSGVACEDAVWADVTVTFAAYKPGHFLHDGPSRCGSLELCDIGLDTSGATMHLFEDSDLAWAIPARGRETHKWKSAVAVIAGSPGMMGAANLVTLGAQRAGAGMVRLLSPGVAAVDGPVGEAVVMDGTNAGWSNDIDEISERLQAIVVGPGLSRAEETKKQIRSLIEFDRLPTVLDADAIVAVSDDEGRKALQSRVKPMVLTPHDGEFRGLAGNAPVAARHQSAVELARRVKSVVLLKGSTTVVSDPDGRTMFVTAGDSRLATAGTGDVLAGIVGAFLAQGAKPMAAAAAAAHVHGKAAKNSYSRGLIASDLPENVAELLSGN